MTTTNKPSDGAVEALEAALQHGLPTGAVIRLHPNVNKVAKDVYKIVRCHGYTLTPINAVSGELAEAVVRLDDEFGSGTEFSREDRKADWLVVKAALSELDALQREVERKDAALEVGIAYIAAAQAGLSFTQLRMKADMSLLEDTLTGKAQQSAVCREGSTTTVDDWRKAGDWISDSRLGKAPPAKPEVEDSCGCVFADLKTAPPNGRCVNAKPKMTKAETVVDDDVLEFWADIKANCQSEDQYSTAPYDSPLMKLDRIIQSVAARKYAGEDV